MLESLKPYANEILMVLIPVGIFVAVFITGLIIRKILFIKLTNITKHSKTHIDDIIVESIKTPFLIWFLMLGIYAALTISKLPEKAVNMVGTLLLVLGMFSVTMVVANIASKMISAYSSSFEHSLKTYSLTKNIIRVLIYLVGFLMILKALGRDIGPLIATLGVGGLAVALALQDTLANLFAGFHIIMNKIITVGDYVKLEGGQEGYVTDITWRSTTIRMPANNLIVVPNTKIAQAIVTNYYLPQKDLAFAVEMSVHYNSDLPKVEKVVVETAGEVMKEIDGGVPEFEPAVAFHTFAESGVNFSVILKAKEFSNQGKLKHEFIKKIHARFKKEGITIPYPIRTIITEPK
jgi:small-conductance mechanosensitive channel